MKTLLKRPRMIILLVMLVLALIAVQPRPWQEGAAIRSIDRGSAAFEAGIPPVNPQVSPVMRERIIAVNAVPVTSAASFVELTQALPPNVTVRIQTNKDTYVVTTRPLLNVTVLPERERVTITEEVYDNETGELENKTRTEWQNKTETAVIGTEPLGLAVYDAPTSNIRYGLDITGGARVLLAPVEEVSEEDLELVIETIKQRMNVYGLSDIVVRPVSDLAGDQFILVEVAGASEGDVRELALQQGKFEARISNETVFRGGDDITYVCRSPQCSGIAQAGCQPVSSGEYACQFQFQITLSPEAAQRQADATRDLAVVPGQSGEPYLEQPLDLYLDDELVDSLQIASSLRGSAVTQISISGSGSGIDERSAVDNALDEMKALQTILVTGSLPVKLEIVKVDSISSTLGDEFIRNALLAGALAFLAVVVVIVIRFRALKLSIPVVITLVSELVIILGVAAVIGWNLDLAAIAGILIAIGTGVDDQIVIADETIGGRKRKEGGMKEKLKKAFFIIFAAYFTALAAMLPLWWAGAGLVRGFAITTILGITIGVLVTRPAFAAIVEHFYSKN